VTDADGGEADTGAERALEAALDGVLRPAPLVVVISGPSGVGKDETIKQMQLRGQPFHFVVTATTRPRRANEVEGRDYHFVSVADFAECIDQGELLEYAVVYGDYKGIPKQQVRDALASGKDVILRIDVQGAATIRQKLQGAVFVFLAAESLDELERRLRERKSEPADALKMRIATARQEMKRAAEFDYLVVNRRGHLDETVDAILAVICAEKHRVKRPPVVL
jgi:guanylate kinase